MERYRERQARCRPLSGGGRWVLFVLCALVLSSSPTAQPEQPVVFASESIAVFVDVRFLRVEGVYVLRNESPDLHTQKLFYPFPVDSLHPRPGYVSVRSADRPVPFRKAQRGVHFSLDIPADSTASVRVVYEQECYDNTGCYILTSTAAWDRPLEAADFEITVADGVELESVTYDVVPAEERPAGRVYRFGRKNFMPEKDLCLRWRPASADEADRP
jgi:hypothetical protein